MQKSFRLSEVPANESRAIEAGTVNQRCTMEVETISKHGQNPKSHTSRSLTLLTAVLVLLVVFGACKKEDDITIANEKELTQTAFADEETTGSFTFTAKENWTADVKSTSTTKSNGVPWLTLLHNGVETYNGNAGTFTIVISLDINLTGQTRTATIEIVSGNDKITITVTQSGTTQSDESGFVINAANVINGNSDIATVRAILTEHGEIASVEYKNGGFKLTLPLTISNENLRKDLWGDLLSDKNAMMEIVFFEAMNSTGDYLANMQFVSNTEVIETVVWYVYSDRSCTMIGERPPYYTYDCSFQKGWNAMYFIVLSYEEEKCLITTRKPSNKTFKWYFDDTHIFDLG